MHDDINQALYILEIVWKNLRYIDFIAALLIVFLEKHNSRRAWTWIMIVYVIPIFGIFIYLLFGANIIKRRMFKAKAVIDQRKDLVHLQEESIEDHKLQERDPIINKFADLIYYNLETSSAILSSNNLVTHISDSDKKFALLKEDIKNAKRFIHIQYYMIKDLHLFYSLVELLIQKAEEGVEVRILIDGMGSHFLKRSTVLELEKHNVHVGVFFKGIFGRIHVRMNYRNHRKIIVIDGDIGYVGGVDLRKEYVSTSDTSKYIPKWRDTHMRIEGLAVLDLGIRFILDWNFAKKEDLFHGLSYINLPKPVEGKSKLQVLMSGPDAHMNHIRDNYLRMIGKAKKSIEIQTPYFIPDTEIMTALRIAVASGIRVNIMIPNKPDYPLVYWASMFYVGQLLLEGAHCYIYERGYLHCKGMIVDREVYCYGTAGLDNRSLHMNFEVNVINYSKDDVLEMVRIYQEDLRYCSRVTKESYVARNLRYRYKEQVSRLFAPLF
ncbi:MAG: cardiolipin synthase [Eubacteriales bacterium]